MTSPLTRAAILLTIAIWLLGSGLIGCSSGAGAIALEARVGRVSDRESGAPVADADVFQVYRGQGVVGAPRPTHALRWTRSDEAGAFAFEAATSTESRASMRQTDPAEYGFYHPEYGLVRVGRPATAGHVELTGERLDAARLRAEQLSLCGSRPADEIAADVVRMHCGHRQR